MEEGNHFILVKVKEIHNDSHHTTGGERGDVESERLIKKE